MSSTTIARRKQKIVATSHGADIKKQSGNREDASPRHASPACIYCGLFTATLVVVMTLPWVFGDAYAIFDGDFTSGHHGMLGMMIVTGFLAVALSRVARPSATAPVQEKVLSVEKVVSATHDYENKAMPQGVELVQEYLHGRAHNCFIAQTGPVCAAASVAGALNIIFNYKSDDEKVRQLVQDIMKYSFLFGWLPVVIYSRFLASLWMPTGLPSSPRNAHIQDHI